MYYAILDATMIGKKEYGSGFANAKTAYAFPAKAKRDLTVGESYDLTARACTRSEALKLASPVYGDRYSNGIGVQIYGTNDMYKMAD
jgi:hypothetical protein